MVDEASEGPRMDVFAASSDGTSRDLFDPKLSAADFAAYVANKLKVGDALPSASLADAITLIAEMRQCVAMFNDAFEYEQEEDDDAEPDDEVDPNEGVR